MKSLLPVFFATLAAVGNAMFALGQKKAAGVQNGMVFVGVSAVVAVVCTLIVAPWVGPMELRDTLKENWKAALVGGSGLFLTYLGFHLLYTRFGASQYVLYAVLSIITTTILVGILWFNEPVSVLQKVAIALAIVAVVLFSLGRTRG